MTFWVTLWQLVFGIGLLIFAGMAIWVTVYGARDIKRLFERIEKSHEDADE